MAEEIFFHCDICGEPIEACICEGVYRISDDADYGDPLPDDFQAPGW